MANTMTYPASQVSPSQAEHFAREGWCIVENLFDSDEINAIENFFEIYKTNGAAVYDNNMRIEQIDPTQTQVRAMHPHRYSRQVMQWALQPAVMNALEVLLNRPALLAQTMYYFKPPGAKGQGMHQDNFYLQAAPATCIAAWTAIDSSEVENGCLYVVPGSHRQDIYCPKPVEGKTWNNYGDSHINPFPREAKPIRVEVPRGATMFFGGQLIHGSGPNRTTDRSRRTFIGHYVDQATTTLSRFYHPVHNAAGDVVSTISEHQGGGPCGDGTGGGVH